MRSVRAKLMLFNILLVAVILAAMGFALRAKVSSNLLAEAHRQLTAQIGSISTSPGQMFEDERQRFSLGPLGSLTKQKREIVDGSNGGRHVVEMLRSNDGQVRLDTDASLPRLIPVHGPGANQPLIQPLDAGGYQLARSGTRNYHSFWQSGNRMLSLSAPIAEAGRLVAVVQAVTPLSPIDRQIADLDLALETLIPIALLVAAAAGSLMVGGAMRPLRRLVESARLLKPDLSGARLPVQGRDEFADLSKEFNEAFDRTSAAFANQREAMAKLERFTGDAGHELKTPAGAIKGCATYLLHMSDLPEDNRKSVQIIDRSVDRMTKLIDDLLLLAHQDAGQPLGRRQEVNLMLLAEETLQELSIPDSISISVSGEPNLTVCGDPDALKRIFTNLLSNAVNYTRSKVDLRIQREDGSASLTVSDDGEGIAQQHLPRLGDRFYRPDDARSRRQGGVGLGLSIVKSLCQAHGGSLEVESQEGLGSAFTVKLPLS